MPDEEFDLLDSTQDPDETQQWVEAIELHDSLIYHALHDYDDSDRGRDE